MGVGVPGGADLVGGDDVEGVDYGAEEVLGSGGGGREGGRGGKISIERSRGGGRRKRMGK